MAAGLSPEQIAANTSGDALPTTLSFGQKAVGLTFNPSGDPEVNRIKVNCAILIDNLNDLREKAGDVNPEVRRMLSIAITEVQSAQMWAVKAVTWRYNE